jgi:hypothetical protein
MKWSSHPARQRKPRKGIGIGPNVILEAGLIVHCMLLLLSRLQGLCVERRKPLGKRRAKDYFCTVVSEDVEIVLKNKPTLGLESKNELFVQCNQLECQYVDLNQSPCPLRLNLFSEEIEKRGRRAEIEE